MQSVPLPAVENKGGKEQGERNIRPPTNNKRPVQTYRERRGHLRKELVKVFALVVGHVITDVGNTGVDTFLALRGVEKGDEMDVIVG